MTRQNAMIAVAAVVVSILAIIVGWKLGQDKQLPQEIAEAVMLDIDLEDVATAPVELYYPGSGGRLYVEPREVPIAEGAEQRLQSVLAILLAGPESPDLFPAMPDTITLGWTYLNPLNIAYVNFDVAGDVAFPAWGSGHELLAMYSVVNTILLNIPEVEAVVLLRNGQQHATFAGHLDTSRPLLANHDLLAVPTP